ncbi:MAG: thioredoxin-dependent thiol peroxidase [Saprospiraceae bacterium]|nr:thioredoxin-dependent thiol peroxidase [Saprospiraceae bacterium]
MARTTRESKLKPGDQAPHFVTTLDDGSELNSKDLVGTRTILFFYPKDDTPTCTKEACNIRDNYDVLRDHGFAVYGVSGDTPRKHQNFIKKYRLNFPLISDKDHVIARQFDIYGPKQFMGRTFDGIHRTTFVIGKDWKVEHIIHPVVSSDHAAQILEVAG